MSDRTLRGMLRQVCLTLLIAGAALTGLSCGGEGLELLTTGILEITTATSGPEPDADGYAVTIDDGAETALGPNATLQRDDVDAGNHSVRLTGMAGNCTLDGQNPRLVSVTGGATAEVRFAITCRATTGSLDVTSATSGPSPDPDGYTITLDGSERGTLGVSGAATLDGLTPGSHAVGLNGIAANCQVQGDNPQNATVTAGTSATVAFAITCAAPPAITGTLRITTTTTGPDRDSDGYAVAVDGGTTQPIGISATASVANVATGAHAVRLSRVAANCSVLGTNPRSVTVVGGTTADASFTVTCVATTGSLEITTTTTGNAPDPDGYTVAIDNGTPQTIGATASLTVPRISPGPHQVTVGDLATNCRVEGDNPRSVTLTAGATARLNFTLSCSALSGSKIAWEGGNALDEGFASVILVMNADGSGQIQLTQFDKGGSPQWSPDGSKILYTRSPDGEVHEVHVMNADGTGKRRLTVGSEPQWLPDGTKISFGDEGGLSIINADGSGQPRVIGGGSNGHRWSPDGTKVLFLRFSDDGGYWNNDIYIMNSDGSGVTQLTHNPVDGLLDSSHDPAWSSDSRRIAFSQYRRNSGSDTQDILVMNADGSSPTNLTESLDEWQLNGQPVWSPDGSKLAFVSGRSLYVMNPDGSNQNKLTGALEVDNTSAPTWSPDGAKVAFASDWGSDNPNIWVVNPDGTGLVQLTRGEFADFSPTWSP